MGRDGKAAFRSGLLSLIVFRFRYTIWLDYRDGLFAGVRSGLRFRFFIGPFGRAGFLSRTKPKNEEE